METEESRTDAIGPGEKSFDTIYFETKRTNTPTSWIILNLIMVARVRSL